MATHDKVKLNDNDRNSVIEMNRRRLMYTVGVGLLAGVSGCLGGNGSGDPEEAAVDYIETLYQGEPEPINELIHPDAPLDEFTESEANDYRNFEIEELKSELITEEDDIAEVRMDITVDGPAGTISDSGVIELRKYDNTWKIWNAP